MKLLHIDYLWNLLLLYSYDISNYIICKKRCDNDQIYGILILLVVIISKFYEVSNFILILSKCIHSCRIFVIIGKQSVFYIIIFFQIIFSNFEYVSYGVKYNIFSDF